MRKTLLGLLPEHPELAVIDQDLKQLFTSWFNRGFLVLQPVSWSSPAHILEKIITMRLFMPSKVGMICAAGYSLLTGDALPSFTLPCQMSR